MCADHRALIFHTFDFSVFCDLLYHNTIDGIHGQDSIKADTWLNAGGGRKHS